MFFSRRKPGPEEIQRMRLEVQARLTVPVKPAVAPPARGNLEREFVDTQTLAINELITDIKKVPDGQYWPFDENNIPPLFAQSFAVLVGGKDFATLLVANDSFATHPQFDLQRRLREAGLKKLTIERASREIVKTLHEMNAFRDGGPKLDDSAAEKAAFELIESAIEQGTSDIHLQTRETYAQVFFRIHGDRVAQPNISQSTAMDLCNVLYTVHGDADSKGIAWDPKIARSTSFDHTTKAGVKVQIRFSSRPIHPSGNFKAVMRILVMDGKAAKPIEEMGHTAAQTEELEEMLVGAQGMVLIVGPTNSGKSSLLQGMVKRIYDRRGLHTSVDTLEQPVEYIMANACQTAVPEGRMASNDSSNGASFSALLKGFLQQDPDVVVIGEIRTEESASGSTEATLAGRKLLSTIHADDPFTVFSRLLEMSVPASVLFMPGFISGIVCQRLASELCPKCAVPFQVAFEAGRVRPALYERVARVADLTAHKVMTKGEGCSHCNGLGIVGRTPCASVLRPDLHMLKMLAAGDVIGARQYWRTFEHLDIDGLGVSQVAHAISKMREGRIDPRDIERQVGAIVRDAEEHRVTQIPGTAAVAEAFLPPALR